MITTSCRFLQIMKAASVPLSCVDSMYHALLQGPYMQEELSMVPQCEPKPSSLPEQEVTSEFEYTFACGLPSQWSNTHSRACLCPQTQQQ